LAAHGAHSGEHEDKNFRRCRAPMVGFAFTLNQILTGQKVMQKSLLVKFTGKRRRRKFFPGSFSKKELIQIHTLERTDFEQILNRFFPKLF